MNNKKIEFKTEFEPEYIVIGFFTLILILLLILSSTNISAISLVLIIFNENSLMISSILCIPLLSLLGIISDFLYKKCYQNYRLKIKKKYPTNAKSSFIIWETNQSKHGRLMLAKMRILRCCSIVAPLCSILTLIIMVQHHIANILILIFLLIAILLCISAAYGHLDCLEKYYKRTQALEQSQMKKLDILLST